MGPWSLGLQRLWGLLSSLRPPRSLQSPPGPTPSPPGILLAWARVWGPRGRRVIKYRPPCLALPEPGGWREIVKDLEGPGSSSRGDPAPMRRGTDWGLCFASNLCGGGPARQHPSPRESPGCPDTLSPQLASFCPCSCPHPHPPCVFCRPASAPRSVGSAGSGWPVGSAGGASGVIKCHLTLVLLLCLQSLPQPPRGLGPAPGVPTSEAGALPDPAHQD